MPTPISLPEQIPEQHDFYFLIHLVLASFHKSTPPTLRINHASNPVTVRMDIVLHYFDEYMGDSLYSRLGNPFQAANDSQPLILPGLPSSASAYLSTLPPLSSLPRDSILRQSLSLYALTYVGIVLLYFSVATLSYYFIFDKRMELHPRFLKNQIRKEIIFSMQAFPWLDLYTLPWFVGDVRGHSMLYDSIAEGPFGEMGDKFYGFGKALPWIYMAGTVAVFLLFTDLCIYWIHRWLHIPWIYKRVHKPHHKWIIPSPFASHAFAPLDGYLQSVPYHAACYIFPIHKYLFFALFGFVNLWSIFIHDSDMISNTGWEHYINGPAHHTLHHIYFTCNYGQYFVWADKTGGSFREPAVDDDPLIEVLKAQERKKVESKKDQ